MFFFSADVHAVIFKIRPSSNEEENRQTRGRKVKGQLVLLKLHVDTFFFFLRCELNLAALCNLDCQLRLVAGKLLAVLDLVHKLVAIEHFAKDDVLTVKPGGNGSGDEEL